MVSKHRHQLTNDELNKAIERLTIESKLNAFAPPKTKKRGKQFVENLANKTGEGFSAGTSKAVSTLTETSLKFIGKQVIDMMAGEKASDFDNIFNKAITPKK